MTLGHGIRSRLEERLVSCLPAATFEMETLCRLAGVVESRAVDTAAVECRARPRLLVNPDFVAERCARDEHLFLLVMHELWHVILAHTRLYPRLTPAHNIAFDAVINAGLARQFHAPEYRGFLEAVNPADSFPGCLLRPPEGWPTDPVPPACGPPGTAEIVARLYPRPDDEQSALPTTQELLDLLAAADAEPEGAPEPLLLGDHADADAEASALDDPLFGETVRRIVASWPPPPFPLGGRDAGGDARPWEALLAPPAPDARVAFARLLRLALGRHPGRRTRRRRGRVDVPGGLGVLPDAADRLRPSRRALGLPATLWTQTTSTRARVPERPSAAHVYLDVSGSMQELLPELCHLLAPYVADGTARAFQFSTTVAPLSAAALRRGRLETTYGTDIRCVLDHVLADPRVRRVLLLTDGYTGAPGDDQRRAIEERRVAVHVVLPAESAWRADLEPVARTLTVLPPLRERSAR
jgi:hypothetical protein